MLFLNHEDWNINFIFLLPQTLE